MSAYCLLRGTLQIDENRSIEDLPDYGWRQIPSVIKTGTNGRAEFEFQWSYEGSEDVAAGDLEEDVGAIFPLLLDMKRFHDATFDFRIVVGPPHPNPFTIDAHLVAMIAALGGTITAMHDAPPDISNDAP